MESDRTSKKEGTSTALAPAWWETFHFRPQCDYKLEFPCRCVLCPRLFIIYGAIFEYAPPPGAKVANRRLAPSYIVAFRGTMLAGDPTCPSDVVNDISIVLNKQHSCPRFCHARETVEKLVDESGGSSVWLAGHSLGAAIALDVGRHMVINLGFNLQTFLFNPPLPSLDPVIGEEARRVVNIFGDIGRCILAEIFPHRQDQMEELFQRLAPWVPNLYVNPKDAFCKRFIAYFERREHRHPLSRAIAREATVMSYRDVIFNRKSERPHLLPCAKLWKNQSRLKNGGHGLKRGHGLSQWWQQQGSQALVLSHKLYTWPFEACYSA
ncbi:hypothetical protein HU200_054604 [Digitaria exilis]|uniref:Fungal lipase-type domain-containing protein n=1 Tax=Digitaria exilis TaxID=1010633 RepID=A0A835E7C7_9POAL|nr:hypothetical protein HU200_054604 [Digitaria exilis]